MSTPKQYMAGSVPRYIRQSKLGHLPLNCLVGSRVITGDNGSNLVFDVIMMLAPDFQRMKANVGLQHAVSATLKADASFNPAFIIADAKHVTVPPDEPDPESYARNHFMIQFGLVTPEIPKAETPKMEVQKTEEPLSEKPPENLPQPKGPLSSRGARDYTKLK